MKLSDWEVAKNELLQDPYLGTIIRDSDLKVHLGSGDVYKDLVESIISQQISIQAARAITQRFHQLFDGTIPEPAQLADQSLEYLREAGISRQKGTYLQNIGRFFDQEALMQLNWDQLTDSEIVALLTKIKGVGEWTVQMVLIFTLNRPDVFPIDDLGIRNACIRLFKLEGTNREIKSAMIERSEAWRPHRSLASRYLWRWYSN
jgi:DNA-3-methyladenine glycosylase II